MYILWYGIGRTIIEGLRTDSLYFFGLSFLGQPIRVSQMIAAVTCVIAGAVLVWMMAKHKQRGELYVDRVAMQANKNEKEEEQG